MFFFNTHYNYTWTLTSKKFNLLGLGVLGSFCLFFLLIVSLVEGSDVFNIQIIVFNWEKLMAHMSFCVLWVACGKVLGCKKWAFTISFYSSSSSLP
jgi:hypothetical protein